MMIYINAGKQIKLLRVKKGLTQEEFSVAINTTQKYISEIENGKKRPSVQVYLKIANFFKVSLDTIFQDSLTFDSDIHTDTLTLRMKYLNDTDKQYLVDHADLFIKYIETIRKKDNTK